MKKRLTELARLVSHLFFPRSCPLCGEPAVEVCEPCLGAILAAPAPLPRCVACGGPSPCEKHGQRYELRARTVHQKQPRELLLAAKYGGVGRLSYRLGVELAPLAPQGGGWTITVIPEHRSVTLLPTGGTHLDWMAWGLRSRTHLPFKRLLRWSHSVTPQKRQPDAKARRTLPRDCFVCASPVPERVLLLDDVSTTGTTLDRAAHCLYSAGAKEVRCLCWSVVTRL